MRLSALNLSILVILIVGSAVGGMVFVSMFAAALYFSVVHASGKYIVLFFMAGLPLLSGVSALALGYTARAQATRRVSVGACIMALYSVAYTCGISFIALYAVYAPDS